MVKGATQKLKPRGVGPWDRGGLGEELRFEGRPPGPGLMEGLLEQASGLRASQTLAPSRVSEAWQAYVPEPAHPNRPRAR